MARRTLDVNRLLLIITVILLSVLLFRLEQYGRAISLKNAAPLSQISEKTTNVLGQDDVATRKMSPGQSGARFAMITMTTFETSYDYLAISNKHNYAKKHGYDMIWDFEPNRKIHKVWDKVTELDKAIKAKLLGEKEYEWLWMLDYDTLITNTTITLEEVVAGALARVERPEEIEMILTPDCWPLNTGSMLVKASSWNRDLIKEWWSRKDRPYKDGNNPSEQDALRDIITDNVMKTQEKIMFIKQWETNAFPEEIKCYDQDNRPWEPGMFVVHFAGAWAHVKEDDPTGLLMRKYSQYVV